MTSEQQIKDMLGVQPAIEHPDAQVLAAKLAEMEAKANEYWNEILRTKAELDNVHKRAERDVVNAHKYALEKFVAELLPVVDSLEHGLASSKTESGFTPEQDKWSQNMRAGIELTVNLFLNAFKKFGVERIDPIGTEFDPHKHEAMSVQENTTVKANTILQVLQKGYILNGRLIRPALVVVSKHP